MPRTIRDSIADLASAFPRDQIGAATLGVYLRELSDLPPDGVELAVRHLMRSSQFFPRIADIRGRVAETALCLPNEAKALTQVAALVTWARIPEQDRPAPPEPHPLVKEALDLVGGAYAFKSADEPGVIRGQFLRLFRELRTAAIRDATIGTPLLDAGATRPALQAAG